MCEETFVEGVSIKPGVSSGRRVPEKREQRKILWNPYPVLKGASESPHDCGE